MTRSLKNQKRTKFFVECAVSRRSSQVFQFGDFIEERVELRVWSYRCSNLLRAEIIYTKCADLNAMWIRLNLLLKRDRLYLGL